MINTETDFFGKQEGEKILFVVRPHSVSLLMGIVRLYMVSLLVFVAFFVLGTELLALKTFVFFGMIISILIAIIGTKIITNYKKRDVAYLTDRRLVRFEPTTLFATNPRSITWDEVVKVKTYPPNVIWKQLAIGNVVVHARTPARPDDKNPLAVTADDIELKDVFYYKDLGNYIDKILFTYKQRPKEMDNIRPFITKPRGERY